MVNEKTALVILAVVATIGIGSAYFIGYVVGASSSPGFGMMGGSWPWGRAIMVQPGVGPAMGGGMMCPGMMGTGMIGSSMMGSGMMGPGFGRQSAFQDTVVISNYAFYPETLVVKKDTTIAWINMDPVRHTVTAGIQENSTGVFTSELLGHMELFSFKFNEAGTYVYHCDPHPYMTGKIIVEG